MAAPSLDPAVLTRLVRLVLGVIFAGFAVNAIGYVVESGAPVAPAIAGVVALLVVQLYLAEPRAQQSRWVLGVQAGLVYVPLFFYGTAWTGMFGFLAGSVLLVLRPAVAWPLFAVITLSGAVAQQVVSGGPVAGAYIAALTVSIGLVVYGLSRLRSLVAELQATRAALVDAAIATQRVAFAADLRDLLGRRLSDVAAAADRARLDPADAGRALGEIIAIARAALADVRSIAGDYRAIAPAEERRAIRPPVALAIVVAFAVAFLVIRLVFVVNAGLDGPAAVVAFGSAAACVLLQPLAARARWVLLLQAVLAFLPILLHRDETLGAVGIVAGSALLVLRSPAGPIVFAAVAVASGVLGGLFDGTWLGVTYPVLVAVNNGLEWATLLFLYALVTGLHATRAEQAALAVAQERLRFARDLHDLLGYSMSAITLKAELASRLVDVDAERAGVELVEIAAVARKALDEIGSIARSPHELALADELASARTLLAAAGATVTFRVGRAELPAAVRTVLATTLREGTTNVLRHSSARRCTVTLAHTDGAVSLTIENDGASAAGGDDGAGLRNLTARVAELGGQLTAGVIADNSFRLHAHIPLVRLQEPAR